MTRPRFLHSMVYMYVCVNICNVYSTFLTMIPCVTDGYVKCCYMPTITAFYVAP